MFEVGDKVIISTPLKAFGSLNLEHKGEIGIIAGCLGYHEEYGNMYTLSTGDLFFESELSFVLDKEPEDWL